MEKGESGKGLDRPELQRLLRFIARHHVTYVIVHKLDRLARDREVDVALTLAIRRDDPGRGPTQRPGDPR